MDGEPWRWRGLTAFKLLDRFAKDEDIEPFLLDAVGFNVLRVFLYTPAKDWGAQAWEMPRPDVVSSFLAFVARYGFLVEIVLFTDDDPRRDAAAHDILAAVIERGLPALWEIGNEPTTHKTIDTRAFKHVMDASGFLYSSGDYEDSARFFGRYLTCHTGRDAEWPRRAHDLLEYYQGGGPNAPTDPAHKVPCVADEPIRPDQATGDRERDFLAYFGTCALLGAGATYHAESLKLANRMTPDELWLASIALQGLNAFPAQAPKGPYRRIDEGPRSLRTYVVEPYSVRIRPTTPTHPEPGWRALDAHGILWSR